MAGISLEIERLLRVLRGKQAHFGNAGTNLVATAVDRVTSHALHEQLADSTLPRLLPFLVYKSFCA